MKNDYIEIGGVRYRVVPKRVIGYDDELYQEQPEEIIILVLERVEYNGYVDGGTSNEKV